MVAQSGEGGAFEVKRGIAMVSERRRSARLEKLNKLGNVVQYKEEEEGAVLRNHKVQSAYKKRKVADTPPPPPMLDQPSAAKDVPSAANEAKPKVDSSADEKSAYARVTETLRIFNKYYLHFVQEEEKRCPKVDKKSKGVKSKEGQRKRCSKAVVGRIKKKSANSEEDDMNDENTRKGSQRPDLKATSEMLKTGTILYPEKRHGPIPGIDVGYQFFSRAEMVALGFHSHWLNGIDYIGKSDVAGLRAGKDSQYSGYKLPLAVSIILSGQYEDDLDNCDDIIYTGQGGNNLVGNRRQIKDQVMARGNLGLKHCLEQSVPVRVTRGHKCANSYVGKVYTYDGLYKVVNYWAEKGMSGFTVYKFRLKRVDGQPPLTTNQVYFTRGRIPNSISELRGLVCDDITCGEEENPVPATNLVDNPPLAPTGFTYIKGLKFAQNVKLPPNAPGCNCRGFCTDPTICDCAKLNGSYFPYVRKNGDRLVEPKAVVFECGPNCGCGPDCINRTSQRGLRYRLEVYRTPRKGWGVRSWDFIPSGAPVCEYVGVLMKTDDIDPCTETNYVFDIDCLQTMKGLDGRERRLGDVSLPAHLQKDDCEGEGVPEFCIDAGSSGNVARFINHSCQPNLFVQCVLSGHHDIKQARVMLIAADNIPPLTELTYDYGYAVNSVVGPDGKIREMACYCGAADCRKRLF